MTLDRADAPWTKLKCLCGCQEFLAKATLQWRPQGGTTASPAGYRCRDCGADVDAAGLIKILERAQKRAELQTLQQELAEDPVPGPARVPTRGGG